MSDHAERDGREGGEYGQMRARVATLESELKAAREEIESIHKWPWLSRQLAQVEAERNVLQRAVSDASVEYEQQLQERDATIVTEREARQEAVAEAQTWRKVADERKREIQERGQTIEEQQVRMQFAGEEILKEAVKVAAMERRIPELETAVRERDARIAELESGKAFQQQLAIEVALRYEMEALKIEIASLKAQLEVADASIRRMDGEWHVSEREVARLRDAIVRVGMARNEFLRGYNCPFCGENGSQYSVPHKADCELVITKAALKPKGDPRA